MLAMEARLRQAYLSELLKILRAHDTETYFGTVNASVDPRELVDAFDQYFEGRQTTSAVLGLDIYQYSKYDAQRQRLIPVLFDYLYWQAATVCMAKERYLFQVSQFDNRFISTGDGGFQIFDTPLHALVFSVYFQVQLHAYNASYAFPRLRRYLGPITIRYTLTYDELFQLDDNFFGPAIINNARILSRDKLNRFLIDARSIGWFEDRVGSLETLLVLGNDDLPTIEELGVYDSSLLSSTVLFPLRRPVDPKSQTAFRMITVQKIGAVAAKQSAFDVYNVYLQAKLTRVSRDSGERKEMVVTVGNLNTAGISE